MYLGNLKSASDTQHYQVRLSYILKLLTKLHQCLYSGLSNKLSYLSKYYPQAVASTVGSCRGFACRFVSTNPVIIDTSIMTINLLESQACVIMKYCQKLRGILYFGNSLFLCCKSLLVHVFWEVIIISCLDELGPVDLLEET